LFRTIGPTQLALFGALGRPSRPAGGKLGSFCTIGPRRPEAVGRRAAVPAQVCPQAAIEKLGSFRTFDPPNWVRFYNCLPAPDYRLPLLGFVSHACLSNFKLETCHFKLLQKLALFRTMGPLPPLASNSKLHTSSSFLSIRLPVITAVLHEFVRKNGFRHPPESP